MTREEKRNDYEGFVEKFKPKKTTDDCMTPPAIYEVVKDYVCSRWGVDPAKIVRPFWPGADYQKTEYPDGAVVVDNPPFSILSKICAFYLERGIPFFLFAPSLTALSGAATVMRINHIICDANVTYENGAIVPTSFVTSYGLPNILESAPDLGQAINDKMKELLSAEKKTMPKYSYPPEVCTAAMVQRYAKYGISFSVKADECVSIRALDAQRTKGKTVYGGGLLLSRAKAAERAAAERAAAERTAAEQWELSPRELAWVQALGERRQKN